MSLIEELESRGFRYVDTLGRWLWPDDPVRPGCELNADLRLELAIGESGIGGNLVTAHYRDYDNRWRWKEVSGLDLDTLIEMSYEDALEELRNPEGTIRPQEKETKGAWTLQLLDAAGKLVFLQHGDRVAKLIKALQYSDAEMKYDD